MHWVEYKSKNTNHIKKILQLNQLVSRKLKKKGGAVMALHLLRKWIDSIVLYEVRPAPELLQYLTLFRELLEKEITTFSLERCCLGYECVGVQFATSPPLEMLRVFVFFSSWDSVHGTRNRRVSKLPIKENCLHVKFIVELFFCIQNIVRKSDASTS